MVAGVATGLPSSQAPLPVRFADFRPVDTAASRLWKDTVNYVKNCVLADDTMATPLVLGHASRMLAAVMLSTFPSTTPSQELPHDRTDYKPVLLRRAIEYVDSNAATTSRWPTSPTPSTSRPGRCSTCSAGISTPPR